MVIRREKCNADKGFVDSMPEEAHLHSPETSSLEKQGAQEQTVARAALDIVVILALIAVTCGIAATVATHAGLAG